MDNAAKNDVISLVNMKIDGVSDETKNTEEPVVCNVCDVIQKMVKDTMNSEELIKSIQNIITTNIHAVLASGKDLEEGIGSVAKGIFKGLTSSGQETFSSLLVLADAIIKAAVEVKADVAAVSRGLINGVIQHAKETGIDVEKAASVAAASAVKAAYKIDQETGDKVKNTATGTIGGVKIVLDSTFVNEKNRVDIAR